MLIVSPCNKTEGGSGEESVGPLNSNAKSVHKSQICGRNIYNPNALVVT